MFQLIHGQVCEISAFQSHKNTALGTAILTVYDVLNLSDKCGIHVRHATSLTSSHIVLFQQMILLMLSPPFNSIFQLCKTAEISE